MSERHRQILTDLCNVPTAPYCEQHVIAWLMAWAERHKGAIHVRRDRAGNVYLEYRRGGRSSAPLVIEAHMDHPGFVVVGQARDGRVRAEFRGTVRPSFFKGARAKFWVNDPPAVGNIAPVEALGRWVKAAVRSVRQVRGRRFLDVELGPVKARLARGTLGMWDLPEGRVHGGLFAARGCDDVAGVAAIVCTLEVLIARKSAGHVIGLCSRAEEVGFAGVLAVCEHGWIPRGSRVIGLEASKASATARQGDGPIIRVGDRTGIFSAGLTHFLSQTAGHIGDADAAFTYQRKLMDGGTCNTTPFCAWGYDAAAMCVALGNYHNQTFRGEIGWGDGARAGPGIGSETIHVGDFAGMVRILVAAAERLGRYEPGLGAVRKRLTRMHREEQRALLYQTSDQSQ